MKMSEKNFNKLKWFYDYCVEKASDEDMEYIFLVIGKCAELKVKKDKEAEKKSKKNA